jgi:hypothetical protein
MKSTQMNRSLATLALMAIIGGGNVTPITAAPAGSQPRYTPADPAQAPSRAGSAFNADPLATGPAGFAGGPATNPYGRGNRFRPGDSERGARLEAKLRDMVLDEVGFDSLPLSEVLKMLSDESRKRDPEKKGINFLINPNQTSSLSGAGAPIDPATGLPAASGPVEQLDVGAITIKFNLPLRHINMEDLLDAIVKVADRPISYSLEDYAVVFSLRPDAAPSMPMMQRAAAPFLVVQTFHVDTNSFIPGLESAFGIKLDKAAAGKDGSRSRQIQTALRELLAQLNITLENNKTVFYNELTGVLMMRATPEELAVVQAAIETLGGGDAARPQASAGLAPQAVPGQLLGRPSPNP